MVNNKLIKLANTKTEIIFIFDNVEDYSFIEKYICNRPESIFVLTTVRNKDTITDKNKTVQIVELGPFSKDQAIKYVTQVLGEKKIKKEEIEELVGIIGEIKELETTVIPFNLNKVVSILSEISLETVKERIKNIKLNPKSWLQTEFYDDFMRDETISKILQFIPYFDPDSIDIKLLALMIDASKDSSFNNALAKLLKNFLIKESENGEQISVHRLLQNDLREYFKSSQNKEKTRKTFIKIIDNKFKHPYDTYTIWTGENSSHMHAICLVERKIIENDIEQDESGQINQRKINIFSKLGAYYHKKQSKYELALSYTQKALEITERLFLGDHQDKAGSYNNIGNLYRVMGDLNKSLEYATKAVEMSERLFLGDQLHQFNSS